MKAAVVTVALTLNVVLTSCVGSSETQTSGNGGSPTSRDCSARVRAKGIVYTSQGFTERSATRYSSAESADCEDTGPDAAGSVFPEAPRHVTTWTFGSYPPGKVLGVRSGKTDSYAVFVADTVSPVERERIYQDLDSRPQRPGRRVRSSSGE